MCSLNSFSFSFRRVCQVSSYINYYTHMEHHAHSASVEKLALIQKKVFFFFFFFLEGETEATHNNTHHSIPAQPFKYSLLIQEFRQSAHLFSCLQFYTTCKTVAVKREF